MLIENCEPSDFEVHIINLQLICLALSHHCDLIQSLQFHGLCCHLGEYTLVYGSSLVASQLDGYPAPVVNSFPHLLYCGWKRRRMRVGAGWALDTLDGWQRVSPALKLQGV